MSALPWGKGRLHCFSCLSLEFFCRTPRVTEIISLLYPKASNCNVKSLLPGQPYFWKYSLAFDDRRFLIPASPPAPHMALHMAYHKLHASSILLQYYYDLWSRQGEEGRQKKSSSPKHPWLAQRPSNPMRKELFPTYKTTTNHVMIRLCAPFSYQYNMPTLTKP